MCVTINHTKKRITQSHRVNLITDELRNWGRKDKQMDSCVRISSASLRDKEHTQEQSRDKDILVAEDPPSEGGERD